MRKVKAYVSSSSDQADSDDEFKRAPQVAPEEQKSLGTPSYVPPTIEKEEKLTPSSQEES